MKVNQQLHQGEGNYVVFVFRVHLYGRPQLFYVSHEPLRADQHLYETVHVTCVTQIRQPERFVVPLDLLSWVNIFIGVVLIVEDA
jgi:hypothetical protein